MRRFKIRFYLKDGGALEVIIEAKNDGEARKSVKAQYSNIFREFASSKEIR